MVDSAERKTGGDVAPKKGAPVSVATHLLVDDGVIPNNPKLPLVIYRQVFGRNGLAAAPERVFDDLFRANGWTGSWVDGIYDYHHYHSTAHEVLGIAAGHAKVQFGGPHGLVCELRAGDVAVIPAGVGHCCLGAKNLVVVGAYPHGQNWDLCRDTEADRARALDNIPWVPLPQSDPVLGSSGPLVVCWID